MTGRIWKLAALSTMMNRESHRTDTVCVEGEGRGEGHTTALQLKRRHPFPQMGCRFEDLHTRHLWRRAEVTGPAAVFRSQSNGEGKGCKFSRRGQLFQICNSALGGWKGPSWEHLPTSSPSRGRNVQRLASSPCGENSPLTVALSHRHQEARFPQF